MGYLSSDNPTDPNTWINITNDILHDLSRIEKATKKLEITCYDSEFSALLDKLHTLLKSSSLDLHDSIYLEHIPLRLRLRELIRDFIKLVVACRTLATFWEVQNIQESATLMCREFRVSLRAMIRERKEVEKQYKLNPPTPIYITSPESSESEPEPEPEPIKENDIPEQTSDLDVSILVDKSFGASAFFERPKNVTGDTDLENNLDSSKARGPNTSIASSVYEKNGGFLDSNSESSANIKITRDQAVNYSFSRDSSIDFDEFPELKDYKGGIPLEARFSSMNFDSASSDQSETSMVIDENSVKDHTLEDGAIDPIHSNSMESSSHKSETIATTPLNKMDSSIISEDIDSIPLTNVGSSNKPGSDPKDSGGNPDNVIDSGCASDLESVSSPKRATDMKSENGSITQSKLISKKSSKISLHDQTNSENIDLPTDDATNGLEDDVLETTSLPGNETPIESERSSLHNDENSIENKSDSHSDTSIPANNKVVSLSDKEFSLKSESDSSDGDTSTESDSDSVSDSSSTDSSTVSSKSEESDQVSPIQEPFKCSVQLDSDNKSLKASSSDSVVKIERELASDPESNDENVLDHISDHDSPQETIKTNSVSKFQPDSGINMSRVSSTNPLGIRVSRLSDSLLPDDLLPSFNNSPVPSRSPSIHEPPNSSNPPSGEHSPTQITDSNNDRPRSVSSKENPKQLIGDDDIEADLNVNLTGDSAGVSIKSVRLSSLKDADMPQDPDSEIKSIVSIHDAEAHEISRHSSIHSNVLSYKSSFKGNGLGDAGPGRTINNILNTTGNTNVSRPYSTALPLRSNAPGDPGDELGGSKDALLARISLPAWKKHPPRSSSLFDQEAPATTDEPVVNLMYRKPNVTMDISDDDDEAEIQALVDKITIARRTKRSKKAGPPAHPVDFKDTYICRKVLANLVDAYSAQPIDYMEGLLAMSLSKTVSKSDFVDILEEMLRSLTTLFGILDSLGVPDFKKSLDIRNTSLRFDLLREFTMRKDTLYSDLDDFIGLADRSSLQDTPEIRQSLVITLISMIKEYEGLLLVIKCVLNHHPFLKIFAGNMIQFECLRSNDELSSEVIHLQEAIKDLYSLNLLRREQEEQALNSTRKADSQSISDGIESRQTGLANISLDFLDNSKILNSMNTSGLIAAIKASSSSTKSNSSLACSDPVSLLSSDGQQGDDLLESPSKPPDSPRDTENALPSDNTLSSQEVNFFNNNTPNLHILALTSTAPSPFSNFFSDTIVYSQMDYFVRRNSQRANNILSPNINFPKIATTEPDPYLADSFFIGDSKPIEFNMGFNHTHEFDVNNFMSESVFDAKNFNSVSLVRSNSNLKAIGPSNSESPKMDSNELTGEMTDSLLSSSNGLDKTESDDSGILNGIPEVENPAPNEMTQSSIDDSNLILGGLDMLETPPDVSVDIKMDESSIIENSIKDESKNMESDNHHLSDCTKESHSFSSKDFSEVKDPSIYGVNNSDDQAACSNIESKNVNEIMVKLASNCESDPPFISSKKPKSLSIDPSFIEPEQNEKDSKVYNTPKRSASMRKKTFSRSNSRSSPAKVSSPYRVPSSLVINSKPPEFFDSMDLPASANEIVQPTIDYSRLRPNSINVFQCSLVTWAASSEQEEGRSASLRNFTIDLPKISQVSSKAPSLDRSTSRVQSVRLNKKISLEQSDGLNKKMDLDQSFSLSNAIEDSNNQDGCTEPLSPASTIETSTDSSTSKSSLSDSKSLRENSDTELKSKDRNSSNNNNIQSPALLSPTQESVLSDSITDSPVTSSLSIMDTADNNNDLIQPSRSISNLNSSFNESEKEVITLDSVSVNTNNSPLNKSIIMGNGSGISLMNSRLEALSTDTAKLSETLSSIVQPGKTNHSEMLAKNSNMSIMSGLHDSNNLMDLGSPSSDISDIKEMNLKSSSHLSDGEDIMMTRVLSSSPLQTSRSNTPKSSHNSMSSVPLPQLSNVLDSESGTDLKTNELSETLSRVSRASPVIAPLQIKPPPSLATGASSNISEMTSVISSASEEDSVDSSSDYYSSSSDQDTSDSSEASDSDDSCESETSIKGLSYTGKTKSRNSSKFSSPNTNLSPKSLKSSVFSNQDGINMSMAESVTRKPSLKAGDASRDNESSDKNVLDLKPLSSRRNSTLGLLSDSSLILESIRESSETADGRPSHPPNVYRASLDNPNVILDQIPHSANDVTSPNIPKVERLSVADTDLEPSSAAHASLASEELPKKQDSDDKSPARRKSCEVQPGKDSEPDSRASLDLDSALKAKKMSKMKKMLVSVKPSFKRVTLTYVAPHGAEFRSNEPIPPNPYYLTRGGVNYKPAKARKESTASASSGYSSEQGHNSAKSSSGQRSPNTDAASGKSTPRRGSNATSSPSKSPNLSRRGSTANSSQLTIKPASKTSKNSSKRSSIINGGLPETWYLNYDYAPGDMILKDGLIVSATKEALVERLTLHDEAIDSKFMETFLLTFRSFSNASEFLELLIARYTSAPPPGLNEEELARWTSSKLTTIRIRVNNIMKTWLESYFYESDDGGCLKRMIEFCSGPMMISMPSAAKRILTIAGEIYEKLKAESSTSKLTKSKTMDLLAAAAMAKLPNHLPPLPMIPKGIAKSLVTRLPFRITNLDPMEVARQLTIMDCRSFSLIRPHELIGLEFSKKTSTAVQHVRGMTEATNEITSLICDCILKEADIKKRADLIRYFIVLGENLLVLKNYNSLMPIVGALNSSMISRLKNTWGFLLPKYTLLFQNLRKATDHSRNYADYRNVLKTSMPPCLPFLGIYLTDLTFTDEGNSAFKDGEDPKKRHVNFAKFYRTVAIVQEIQKFQVPYNLIEIKELQERILLWMKTSNAAWDEDVFYNKSLALEPRKNSQPPLTVRSKVEDPAVVINSKDVDLVAQAYF